MYLVKEWYATKVENYKIEHFFIELTMITGQVIEKIFLVCELMDRAILEARQTIVLSTHI